MTMLSDIQNFGKCRLASALTLFKFSACQTASILTSLAMCRMYSSIHTPAFVYTVTYHFSPPDLTLFTTILYLLPLSSRQSSHPTVALLETGRYDRRPGFDDLNLLDISLKCIELFVAQAVMSDCEEYFYDGAVQGFIDVAGFHESCVSLDSKGTCHQIVFHGFKFFFEFHWDWPLLGFGVHHRGPVCAPVSSRS
jgi:hypothetical protein